MYGLGVYRQEILSIQKKMSSKITNSQIKYIRYTEWDIIYIDISFGILWRIFNNIGWELEKNRNKQSRNEYRYMYLVFFFKKWNTTYYIFRNIVTVKSVLYFVDFSLPGNYIHVKFNWIGILSVYDLKMFSITLNTQVVETRLLFNNLWWLHYHYM